MRKIKELWRANPTNTESVEEKEFLSEKIKNRN